MARDRLIHERRIRRFTQRHVAERVGVTFQMISEVERGKRTPSLGVANKLEDLFQIPSRQLLALREENPQID